MNSIDISAPYTGIIFITTIISINFSVWNLKTVALLSQECLWSEEKEYHHVKEILTTAQAAKLLGISVRTAQLWVESGALPSWKTPGGHRRIPRSAVMPLIQGCHPPPPPTGTRAVVLAGPENARAWQALSGCGFVVDIVEDSLLAAIRIGEILPSLIVIDDDGSTGRLGLLDRIHVINSLGPALVAVHTDQPIPLLPGPAHLRLTRSLSVQACIDTIQAQIAQQNAVPTLENVPYPVGPNEAERLQAVNTSGLLFTPRETAFDRLILLAARLFDAPLALFTLLTATQQWFKAGIGYDGESTPREWSLCNYTLAANELTVVEDLTLDPRVSQHLTIDAPFNFRFYAGAPVRDENGFALGSVCIIDRVPRRFGEEDRDALATLAEAASQIIRFRAQTRALRGLRPPVAQNGQDAGWLTN
ncbi:GAF domain-containing protein [Rhizobium halophilum]|uniref:GAF domain-containing protein n=1 Tax=Rhizobium halophilum TaxID=2846852 RepID=UPI001EFE9EEA|nr:GAF domain-containing protein [Rhizobium halophilum]MCF6371158.1 excisionase family DNA-binding protein [Rhizobium halophilum]